MDISYILLGPVTSEKTVRSSEATGIYTFLVHENATKVDVKNAFWILYGREVQSVRIVSSPKKTRLVGRGKEIVKRKKRKKAYIRFKENTPFEMIDVKGIKAPKEKVSKKTSTT